MNGRSGIWLLLWVITTAEQQGSAKKEGKESLNKRYTPVLTYAALVEPPFVMENAELHYGRTRFHGFLPDLIQEISRELGEGFTINRVTNGGYGVNKSNGRWNGMIGDVMDGVADVGAGALSVTAERDAVVDFTEPYMSAGIAIVVKKPERGRRPQVTSLYELANHKRFSYGLIYGSLTYSYFKNSKHSLIQKMWRAMSAPGVAVNTIRSRDGLEKVRRSNRTHPYAFLMENRLAEYLTNRKPCDLMIVGEPINPVDYAFIVKKNTPLLDRLNKAVRKLKENGTVHRLQNKWWKSECIKQYKITDNSSTVQTSSLANVMFALTLSYSVLSTLL